jgi:DNA-binding FadR family transcriptional regulator
MRPYPIPTTTPWRRNRLLDATHNPLVKTIGRAVEELYHRTIQATNRTDIGRGSGITGHRSILEAIRRGDPETIRQTVRASLAFWATEVEREGSDDADPHADRTS